MRRSDSIVIADPLGLHARPATFFVQLASMFHKTTLWIELDSRRQNAKSLLGVFSLGAVQGSKVSLIADGPENGPEEEQSLYWLSYILGATFKSEEERNIFLKHVEETLKKQRTQA